MDYLRVLSNPYFLGYVLVVLLLFRGGNGIKRMHQKNVKDRQAKSKRPPAWDGDA